MCDIHLLQSSVLFWMLPLIPNSILSDLALGVMSASFIIHALRHICPSVRLDQLTNAIALVDETWTHAKAKCMRDYLALVDAETRFLR
jgi:hypothetical protein